MMPSVRAYFTPYRVFYTFCALLFPLICAGAIWIAMCKHIAFGLFTVGCLVASFWHSFATTCSRCHFYGTGKCGIPGKVVPFFFKKRSLKGFPLWRIKANLYSEVVLMIYLNAIYTLRPLLLPATLGVTAIIWLVVYRGKRFHGLLYLLESKRQQRTIPIRAVEVTRSHPSA
jgi:hypothetical protein